MVSYCWQFFILPVLAFVFYGSGGVTGTLTGEDQDKKVIKYLSLLHILADQVSCFLLEWVHIFSSFPLTTDASTEAFLAAVSAPGQVWFYRGFSFLNLISGCLDNLSVFLPATFVETPVSTPSRLLFMLGVVQEFLGYPHRPPGIFA